MDLSIPYANVTNKDEAFGKAKEAITPEMLAKFQVKAEIEYGDYQAKAKGKGFELTLDFTETSLDVKLDLSFLLKPLKSKVLEGLEKQIRKIV